MPHVLFTVQATNQLKGWIQEVDKVEFEVMAL